MQGLLRFEINYTIMSTSFYKQITKTFASNRGHSCSILFATHPSLFLVILPRHSAQPSYSSLPYLVQLNEQEVLPSFNSTPPL